MEGKMSKEFPLYPALGEAGEAEAQALVDKFKDKLKAAADEVIGSLYCDVATYIESDSWSNFRNQIMEGFKDYDNRKIQNEYDFKNIRAKIYKEYRDDIIADLNQDLIKEVEDLKRQLEQVRELHKRF
jgi:hypothetical protein